MLYTIEDFKKYLNTQVDLSIAISNLSDESIRKIINWHAPDLVDDIDIEEYEKQIGLYDMKNEQLNLWYKTKGKNGKYWLACSPKLIDKERKDNFETAYKIYYWVNYGDDETYGAFTVEQIIKWLTTPNLKLCTLGGTNEKEFKIETNEK
jgi:hypothetical protein